ncbi:MAG: hypothetical protein ABSC51_10835 [Gaiellaceae bacterium]
MILAFDWTSWYGLIVAIAAGVVTIGGAFVLIFGGAKRLAQIVRPRKPLISFGHPSEAPTPMVFFITDDPEEDRRQHAGNERARLSSLRVSYLIENKGGTAVRELSTGIRSREGAVEHTFEKHFVQILAAGEKTELARVSVPNAMHEGMTESNRALNFLYWARFFDDSSGKRWEVLYDPITRRLTYRRLRRSIPFP